MNLEDAFGPKVLGKTVELHAKHAANATVLSSHFRSTSDGVSGDLVEWDEVVFPRSLAGFVDGDAPSIRQKNLGKTKRSSTIAHIKLNKFLGGRKLWIGENAVGELKPNANAVIGRDVLSMTNCILRTKEWLASKVFTGTITVNSTTVEDSETAFSVSFAVNTFEAGVSWAEAATPIISDDGELPYLKGAYTDDTSAELEKCLFSRNVETALLRNTEIKDWAKSTALGNSIMELGRVQLAGGIRWIKYDKNYIPTGGASTPFIASGYGIFLPSEADYGEYLEYAEGQGLIPQSCIGGSSDGMVSIAKPGINTYAMLQEEPIGVKIVQTWCGLPISKYPNISVYANLFANPSA